MEGPETGNRSFNGPKQIGTSDCRTNKQTNKTSLITFGGGEGGVSSLLVFNCKPRRGFKLTAEEHDDPPTCASALHLQGWIVASAEVDALPITIMPCIETTEN